MQVVTINCNGGTNDPASPRNGCVAVAICRVTSSKEIASTVVFGERSDKPTEKLILQLLQDVIHKFNSELSYSC